ncbi:lysozyme [Rubrivirga sp. IMCC43871]|uniref:lysozyme n=1 Tax=Rubrivirga sp. IMCC43871 TaxID=3391575 RepID=UPI0039901A3E
MPHPANDALRISSAGLALIERFEGFEPDWYLDPVGVRTIAYGWTGALPAGLSPPLTQAQGRQLLRDTVGAYESAVRRSVAVPLAQAQFDALVSFTYNLGASNLASSTLLRLLNEGDARAAAEQFDRWVLAGGRALPGLVRRRAAERALFTSGTGPSDRIPVRPPHVLDNPPPVPDVRVSAPPPPPPSQPPPAPPAPDVPRRPDRSGW